MDQVLWFIGAFLVVSIAGLTYIGVCQVYDLDPTLSRNRSPKKTELEQSRDYIWELYEKIERLNDKITQIERLQLKELTTAEQWAILEAARQDLERKIDLTEMEIEVMQIWQHNREFSELMEGDDK